ncbi:MAG: DMT family transporter [Chloroflexota bacterium]
MFWGQVAALGTAISFSFGSTMFTLAGRMVGSPLVNRMRLLIALPLVMLLHLVATGNLLPLDAELERWFWLGLSGVIGLALGDAFLFQGFVMIGPRLSMLVMALAPVLSTIMAWLFLQETLTALELAGIVVTIAGIAWVISERGSTRDNIAPRAYIIGLLFAFGGAMGQAGGLVTSKVGLEGDFLALSGNLIRLSMATLAVWAFTVLRGGALRSFSRARQYPRALLLMSGGAFTGPVIGVWLSLIAVQRAPVGIASTLMALTPVFLIPISYVIFREKPTVRAILGTLVAFAGTALLFL